MTKKYGVIIMIFALLGLVAGSAGLVYGKHTPLLVYGFLALNFATFIAYGLDKSAARRGAWRISESTLLLLGLAGGWPGALIAQQVFRHKSSKTSFRVLLWITILLNCGVLVWLHTEGGNQFVQRILGLLSIAEITIVGDRYV